MGRGNRHWTDTHPDRKMWSPGRLAVARTQTQEEYEALYGRGPAVGLENQIIESDYLVDGSISLSTIKKISSSADLREFLETHVRSGSPPQTVEGDPLFEALWKQELVRLGKEMEVVYSEVELDGTWAHWADRYLHNRVFAEELRAVWMNKIIPTFLERNWSKNTPYSILAAALESQTTRNLVANQLRRFRQSGSDRYSLYFEREIMPEARHLAAPLPESSGAQYSLPTPQLSMEIWESMRDVRFRETNLQAHVALLGRMIDDGGGDSRTFINNPLLSARSLWRERYFPNESSYPGTSLYQEAVMELDWEAAENGNREEALQRAADVIFRRQLRRIVQGAGRDDRDEDQIEKDAWAKYARSLLEGTACESPLQKVRPIFIAEHQEQLLDDFQQVVDNQILRSIRSTSSALSRRAGYTRISDFLTDGVDFLEGIEAGRTISEQMIEAGQAAAGRGELL